MDSNPTWANNKFVSTSTLLVNVDETKTKEEVILEYANEEVVVESEPQDSRPLWQQVCTCMLLPLPLLVHLSLCFGLMGQGWVGDEQGYGLSGSTLCH